MVLARHTDTARACYGLPLGGAMAETDDYRGHLAACWRMAEKASNEVEKRAWLDMAESWKLLIISGYEGSTINDFETASHENEGRGRRRARDTGRSFALSRVVDGSPAWLAGAISIALQLNDAICEISRSRWLVGAGWWQERGFEIVCSVHCSLVQLTKRRVTEGRTLARPTFITYLFRSKEEQRAPPRQVVPRRNFSSLPGQPHAESGRQGQARSRAKLFVDGAGPNVGVAADR